MTIASAIQNAQENVRNAYTAVSEKGGTVPTEQNLNNLPEAINSISGGAGDIVNTTAMSGAESFTGGEKVILNPSESLPRGAFNTIGSDFTTNNSTLPSRTYSGGIIIGNTIRGATQRTIGYPSTTYAVRYVGSIVDNTISLTTSEAPALERGSMELPLFSKNRIGFVFKGGTNCRLVRFAEDGEVAEQLSNGSGATYRASDLEGTVFLDGRYTLWISFVNEDESITRYEYADLRPYSNLSVIQVGDVCYATGVEEGYSRKIVEFSKEGVIQTYPYASSVIGKYYPLDNQGTFFITNGYASAVQKFSAEDKSFTDIQVYNPGGVLPRIGTLCGVLPATETKKTADIFIIPYLTPLDPVRIDQYVWDGVDISFKKTLLGPEELGEYTAGGSDASIDGNTGILWGTFYEGRQGSAVVRKGKIVAVRLEDKVMTTQFKAEPADQATFNPSVSLTGFVDSNLGKDTMGNTELSVKTVLVPNTEPWSDVGKAFGFDVKVEKGE